MTTHTMTSPANPATDTAHASPLERTTHLESTINAAIEADSTLRLHYQGNARHIIPLVQGQLKNGKQAMLCYRIMGLCATPRLELRLYHLDKISSCQATGLQMPCDRRIDYYLTKHFRTVSAKV